MNDRTETGHADALKEFESARDAMLDAYASFLDAQKHLRKAALAAGIDLRDNAHDQIDAALSRARDKKDELKERTGDYVRDNPLTSASLAFLAGVVITRMFGK